MTKTNIKFVGIGFVLWLMFLILIRLIGATVFSTGNPLLPVMFLAAIPLVLVTIVLLGKITAVSMRDMPMPAFVMTLTALLLDGLAVGFTDLYGTSSDQVRASAAFLLWGAGMGLLCSLLLANRGRTTK